MRKRTTMADEPLLLSDDGVVTIVSEVDSGVSELADEDAQSFTSPRREKLCSVLVQVAIPFIIAGFGMMAAGLLLDTVQVHTHSGYLPTQHCFTALECL